MYIEFLNFFQMNRGHIEIYTVQSESNNINLYVIFIFCQFYAKLLDYRAVGLATRSPFT